MWDVKLLTESALCGEKSNNEQTKKPNHPSQITSNNKNSASNVVWSELETKKPRTKHEGAGGDQSGEWEQGGNSMLSWRIFHSAVLI